MPKAGLFGGGVEQDEKGRGRDGRRKEKGKR